MTAEGSLAAATAVAQQALADGDVEKGRAALRAALAEPGSAPAERARALYLLGRLAFRAGDQDESRRVNEEALAVAREGGDVRGEVDALVGLSRVSFRDGDYERVRALAGEARTLAQTLDDAAAESMPLHMLAGGTRLSGDFRRARDLYAESLALFERRGSDAGAAMEHQNLAWVELHLGDVDAAERHLGAAGVGEGAYSAAWRDVTAAALALVRGDRDEAARLLASGEAGLAAAGVVADPDDQFELDWIREQLEG